MIFISYSTRNSGYAYRLAEKLRADGFDVWIDNASLRSNDNWWDQIVDNVRRCSALIVIMTDHSKDSRWVQREVLLADELEKPIFPILLGGDNWEIFIATQYSDHRDGSLPSASFVEDIGAIVQRRRGQRGRNLSGAETGLPVGMRTLYRQQILTGGIAIAALVLAGFLAVILATNTTDDSTAALPAENNVTITPAPDSTVSGLLDAEYSQFANLLLEYDITLRGDVTTVFAPTNTALTTLNPTVWENLQENEEWMRAMLAYHVAPGVVGFQQGDEIVTALGDSLPYTTDDTNATLLGYAQVGLDSGIALEDGFVFPTQMLLLPPRIQNGLGITPDDLYNQESRALTRPDLETLISESDITEEFRAAILDSTYDDLLATDNGTWAVFVPLVFYGDDPPEFDPAVLDYLIAQGDALQDGVNFTTQAGTTITIQATKGDLFAQGVAVSFGRVVQARNGWIIPVDGWPVPEEIREQFGLGQRLID
jgi:hypothetical protein